MIPSSPLVTSCPTRLTCFSSFFFSSKPISISPFSLDDFAGALSHATLEPRCTLIAEMHACLTNLIGTDTSRVLGSTSAPALPSAGAGPSTEPSTPTAEEDGQESDVEEGEEGDEHGEEEFDMLLRKGIQYAKRWDRQAKLKMADGREGWERHLVGALCQVSFAFRCFVSNLFLH